jgi:hypothetical protein
MGPAISGPPIASSLSVRARFQKIGQTHKNWPSGTLERIAFVNRPPSAFSTAAFASYYTGDNQIFRESHAAPLLFSDTLPSLRLRVSRLAAHRLPRQFGHTEFVCLEKVAVMRTIHNVLTRLRAEYVEMPGLRLTAEQVQRLCGIERKMCQSALDALVDGKFLSVKPDGTYVRSSDVETIPGPRPAKAYLGPDRRAKQAS